MSAICHAPCEQPFWDSRSFRSILCTVTTWHSHPDMRTLESRQSTYTQDHKSLKGLLNAAQKSYLRASTTAGASHNGSPALVSPCCILQVSQQTACACKHIYTYISPCFLMQLLRQSMLLVVMYRCPLPSEWDRRPGPRQVMSYLKVDGLVVKYVGPGDDDQQAAAVRSDHPVPADVPLYYFEVEVINRGDQGFIGGCSNSTALMATAATTAGSVPLPHTLADKVSLWCPPEACCRCIPIESSHAVARIPLPVQHAALPYMPCIRDIGCLYYSALYHVAFLYYPCNVSCWVFHIAVVSRCWVHGRGCQLGTPTRLGGTLLRLPR